MIREMLFKVTLATDKGKNLICRIFIDAGMILFCVHAEFCIMLSRIFSNDFLQSSLIKSFFHKSGLVQDVAMA